DGAAPAAGGERRLVAYLVAAAGAVLPEAAVLRGWLGAKLPDHMIPTAFVHLERLPVTPNGKLDRRALPAPGATPRELVPPRDGIEEALAEIWSGLLKSERIGVFDNFFELGGHSLMATRVIAAARERFGVEIALRTLFERPTIAELALAVAEGRVERADSQAVAQMLDDLENLSDEEVERLLAAAEEEEEGAG
ncbi:MAG: phosphopantetheine-binding protein, partial [Acidobacteriota bacterium]|nr:phosphopantetheine-binding protein [Acidobacteriota bacterium]